MSCRLNIVKYIGSLYLSRTFSSKQRCLHHPVLTKRGQLMQYKQSWKYFTTAQGLQISKDSDPVDKNEEPDKQTLGEIAPRIGIRYKCKICSSQNSHTFSRKAYTEGVVIVQCDSCKSNHLIADNLGWFKDINKRYILRYSSCAE